MKLPSKTTLKKYGITEEEYKKLYDKYGGRCHVCLRLPKNNTRALHVEHEHVKGWKKMPPEEKSQYIRGLACYVCNRFRLTKGTTRKIVKNMLAYLTRYEEEKARNS